MRKYIIYKIVNKLNNMIYIGCHVTKNVNDSYMGSGVNIKKAIKKYGLENFDKYILYQFDNENDMLNKEAELVNREFISENSNYNVIIGGGQFLTIDTIPVIDNDGNHFRVHKNDERYLSGEFISINKIFIPVRDNEGNILSVSKDDIRYLSGELISINKLFIPVKDNDGNTFKVKRDDPRYLSGELKYVWVDKKHTDESKKKIGDKNSINQMGNKNSQFGTCWITKEGINKKIKKEDLESYITDNWLKGRNCKVD